MTIINNKKQCVFPCCERLAGYKDITYFPAIIIREYVRFCWEHDSSANYKFKFKEDKDTKYMSPAIKKQRLENMKRMWEDSTFCRHILCRNAVIKTMLYRTSLDYIVSEEIFCRGHIHNAIFNDDINSKSLKEFDIPLVGFYFDDDKRGNQ